MAIKIDEMLYRSLYDEALRLVTAMTPKIAEHALAEKRDPANALGDALDTVFRRVLEGFERQGEFLEDPKKRPPSPARPKPRVPFA